jgi:hypothetical protein
VTAQQATTQLLAWLDQQVRNAGRGDSLNELPVEPKGRFWLGRLASEEAVIESGLGERGERLDPCAVGVRLKPSGNAPWTFVVEVGARVWMRDANGTWRKCPGIREAITISIGDAEGDYDFGQAQLTEALRLSCGQPGLTCVIRIEMRKDLASRPELTILLVNTSPKDSPALKDTTLYECAVEVSRLSTEPFILESLPDSFRYDRRVPAYGINCGVQLTANNGIRTTDAIVADRPRPKYWSAAEPFPDLTFAKLAADPLPSLSQLVEAHTRWGREIWTTGGLDDRSLKGSWSPAMRAQADAAAAEFWAENKRLIEGVELLRSATQLFTAFTLMNRAMSYAANGKYDAWRPFQIGFLLANLSCITSRDNDAEIADVVWFATGGGKTETYLGLLITAALCDRLRGKSAGITAWSRFPLRMLSLQQTQRFADAMAGAERVRREEAISGDPFSVGFLVGQGATPNSISEDPPSGEPDPEDDKMPARYRVLLKCPFCHEKSITMTFDRRYWRLAHQCSATNCPWPERHLPFYIVDDEIYRFLPTVIVGTLDKAASIAMQGGMRCLVGSPLGVCSEDGHGYTYAPRSKKPNGCLVPGCQGRPVGLSIAQELYAPTFRLQDELHLLKDSLGAVDSHYESLLDHLESEVSGRRPKILASSATLTGYERQIALLYRRAARVFPIQGPSSDEGFWTSTSDDLARRYVAVAPRGVTIEYAVDRTVTELQSAVRRLRTEPDVVCAEAGIDASWADQLLSLYGVDVVYGNTLRDLDAVARSLETQVNVDGALNTASLTGRTDFEDVRATLDRLEKPELAFEDRVHVVTASSMMSHGVDIDRLNVMVMLGIPLTAAEFIQATARVGRRSPGLVYVMHKMARERDASVFRSFDKFVQQGDRFVEPIPITRRSRRVLEKTIAGLVLARVLAVHEAQSGEALTTIKKLRSYFVKNGVTESSELEAVIKMLGFDSNLDEALRNDLQKWFRRFFENLMDPGGTFKWPSDLSPTGKAMRSLRDVEEEAPILGV